MTIGGRTRVALEREKTLVLRSIKELEFDFAMGKIAKADFDEMSGRLRARALGLMRQLDAGGGYEEQIEQEVEQRLARRRLAVHRALSDALSGRGAQRASVRVRDRRTIPTRSSARTAERSCDTALRHGCGLGCGFWLSALLAASARAQRARRSRCPIPSAIAGTPLPAPELPDRTVTVRVVRERMGNNIAGQAVTLKVGSDTRTRQDRRAGPRAVRRA